MAASIGVWLIFATKPEAKKFKEAPALKLRTEVMSPKPESYQVWVPSYGIIKPKTQSLVIAQVSGQVTSVSDRFRDGAFFEKGEVLLTIDDADYLAQFTIAQAELKQAEFAYQDEKARSELALKDWQELGHTTKPPSLVAREPQLNSTLSNLEASKAKVTQAELNLKRTKIIAPYAGRVLNLEVNVGQVVSNGTTLGSVYAVDAVEVRLPLKTSDLTHLSLPESYRNLEVQTDTDPIEVQLQTRLGNKNHSWYGHLVRVEGTIDEQTRQLFVVVEVSDPYQYRTDGTPPLKVGQFVNALIKGHLLENVVVLPRAAVASGGYINLVEHDILRRMDVTPVWVDDEHIVMPNLFKDTQLISTTPLGGVVSGTKVSIIQEGLTAAIEEKKVAKGKKPNKAQRSNAADHQDEDKGS